MKTEEDKEQAQQLKRLVKVKMTQVGRGLFARVAFPSDHVVGEIRGTVVGNEYASNYAMDLDGKALLEPGPPFRFLNHCCSPNCQLLLWKTQIVKGQRLYRIWLQTIREIEIGDEMTIDYAWPAEAAIRCMCGAANCRGWVVDATQLKRPRRMGLRRPVSA